MPLLHILNITTHSYDVKVTIYLLRTKYAEDFIEIVKKANVLFLDYSDRKLTHCINKYAIAMLRGEKS